MYLSWLFLVAVLVTVEMVEVEVVGALVMEAVVAAVERMVVITGGGSNTVAVGEVAVYV